MERPAIDFGLLHRYDVASPRYALHPAASQLTSAFDERALREAICETNGDPIPRSLSLNVRLPCGDACLARLAREIAMVGSLFDRDREVVQLHFGGDGPGFLSWAQLEGLVESMRRRFSLCSRPDAEVSIDVDRHVVSARDLGTIVDIGFNRMSLAVQDVDPGTPQLADGLADARSQRGLRSISVHLVYGLPRQTEEAFGKTLDMVVKARPDRVAVRGYTHTPRLLDAHEHSVPEHLPSPTTKLALLQLAVRKLCESGYAYIGMDQFALPEDDLARAQGTGELHRNLLGYTTHPETDVVGLGVGAMSHVGPTFSQNHGGIGCWQAAIDESRLPVMRGLRLTADGLMRHDLVAHLIGNAEVPIAMIARRYKIDFGSYFEESLHRLQPMIDDGLVRVERDRIATSAEGRLQLGHIAKCFDRYQGGGVVALKVSQSMACGSR